MAKLEKVEQSKFNPVKWSGYGVLVVGSYFVITNVYSLWNLNCITPMIYCLLGTGAVLGGIYLVNQSENWKVTDKYEIAS